jgi:dsDNA-specific endonuclease/ATPase MutS2
MALWKPEPRKKQEVEESSADQRLKAALNVLENRALALERDVQLQRKAMEEFRRQREEAFGKIDELRARLEAELATLALITKEAREILERGKKRITTYTPTSEEIDFLKGPVAPQPAEPAKQAVDEKIPTLKELEEARARHHSHLNLDLKTILRDQLA